MNESDILELAVALGLGLLAGLQREWANERMAGIRTFPLITLLGALCARVAPVWGGWVVPAGLLAVAILVATIEYAGIAEALRDERPVDLGLTTEMAILLMFLVGVAVGSGLMVPGLVAGAATAVLLHLKEPLHGLVERLGADDATAIFRFVLISLVVLPILPNRTFGPYGVLNPFEIWLMVVLIVGISLAAYVGARILGQRGGTLVAGLLGGLISSTATTASYATKSRREVPPRSAALVIVLASTVVAARVLVEIAVVSPASLRVMAPPIVAVMVWMAVVSAAAYLRAGSDLAAQPPLSPPSELRGAIVFGLLYALVLLAVAAARHHLGEGGLYSVAALSGLTDMDAITLSTVQMAKAGRLEETLGWRLIITATIANLLFKSLVALAIGGRRLLAQLGPPFAAAAAGAAAVLWLWA